MAQRLTALAALVEDQDFTFSMEYVNSRPSAAPVAGDSVSSSDFHRHWAHTEYMYIQANNTHTYTQSKKRKTQKYLKKKSIVDVFEVCVSVFFFIKKT